MERRCDITTTRAATSVAALALLGAGALLGQPAFVQRPEIGPNPNPAAPLAAVVRFKADRPVTTTIRVSDGENTWELRYGASHDPEKGLPVIGMRPARKHHIRVRIEDASGKTAEAREALEFTTPPLPEDRREFPPILVKASRPERMEPGVTILSVRRLGRADSGPAPRGRPGAPAGEPDFAVKYGLLLALDARGEPVWYYRSSIRISDFEPLPNGNIVFLGADQRAIEIDMLGNVVRQWYAAKRPQGPAEGAIPIPTAAFHHDIEALPNGHLLVLGGEVRRIENYYTSDTDPDAPRKTQKVMGDEVIEFTREGKLVWRWNAFDHLDPYFIGHRTLNRYWIIRGYPETLDWTHGNGLFYDPRDDSILLNLRKLSAVLKIRRPGGELDWIFSEPTGWSERFRPLLFRPVGEFTWPWYQHAPELTPQGTLLLFNNGIWESRPFTPAKPIAESYSRAMEFALDPETKTARLVWVSDRPGPDAVTTYAMGDADWLPQRGNVLVCYGGSTRRVKKGRGRPWPLVREFAHTNPPELLYEVVLAEEARPPKVDWLLFGAKRVPLPFTRPAAGGPRAGNKEGSR